MRAVIIENGVVVNCVVVDGDSPDWVISETAGIGDLYDGQTFTRPEPVVVPEPILDLDAVQIRKALSAYGLRGAVEDAVSQGTQSLKDEWEFSTTFKRNHPSIEEMRVALGVTQEQLDDLFRLGVTL